MGLSPSSPTTKKTSSYELVFFVVGEDGLKPISMQLSGGQLLPPVQKLVATLIFAKGENVLEPVLLPLKS